MFDSLCCFVTICCANQFFFRIELVLRMEYFQSGNPLRPPSLVAQNNPLIEPAYCCCGIDASLLYRYQFFRKARMIFDTGSLQFLGFATALGLSCSAVALIDIRQGIIPNRLNLLIAGLGLAKTALGGGATAGMEALGEAAAVGAIFWLLRRLYFVMRKVQGIGLGDVKLLAAATAWIGISGIPMLLLIATLTALAAIGSLQVAGQDMTRQTSLPFGPFLAIGLLATFAARHFLGVA
jgi:leader peptidase (prepilin peptidase)/N-methyltransferase